MAKKKMDRRARRTRAALTSAFAELVLSRGYEAVTIGEISDKANVGRSTFYSHYRSKEDLLEESLQRPSSGLAACVGGDATCAGLIPLLDHFREQRAVNRVFFEPPIRTIWVRALAGLIEPRLPRAVRGSGVRPLIPPALIALLVAEMQIALIVHWLTGRFALTSQVVAAALIANTHALLRTP